MKFMFFFNIISLFFFSIITCKKCNITAEDLSLLELESNSNYISLNECSSNNYDVRLKVNIPETNYDLLKFELEANPNITNPNIYFYLKSYDEEEFKGGSNIELKLSEITFGTYHLKITFNKKSKKTLSRFNLKNFFSLYNDKKRLKDNDQYTLHPGEIKNLIYEYGLSENKITIFKVLGNSIKDFNFKYEIENENKTIGKTFFNGYSLIINNDLFTAEKDKDIKFYFEDNDEKLDISTSLKNDEDKIIDTTNNHFDIILLGQKENYTINLDIEDSEKYIFKFTTYTKNIIANFFNDGDSKEYQFGINKESSYFILDNLNKYTKVIFNKIGDEEHATLSFDVLYLGNSNYSIIRGLPQRNILYYNMTALYKPDNYPSESKMAVINSHIIKGNPNFYYYTNPNSNVNNKIISVNGFISFKYEINKENPTYLKVECPSNECIFDIDMKSNDEFTYLIKDYKMFCFLGKSDIDKYQINVNNINNQYYLLINIHYPTLPPNITIDNLKKNSDEYKINLIENVISYNILIEDIDKEKSDNIFIYISAINLAGVYYGINYEIKEENNKNINIENDIAYLIDLENDINSKNFIVRKNPDSKLIINLNTFGNDLVLKIGDNEHIPTNNLIHIEFDENEEEKEEYYSLNIRNNSRIIDRYINLYTYEPTSDTKIFIQEGIEYNNKLTNNNNGLSYYLHLNKRKEYNLYFSKYSNSNIKITINNEPSKIINKKLEIIDITQNECLNEVCELLIKIEKENEENDEKDIDFSFQIKENDQIKIIKNTFFSGIIERGEINIYNGTYEDNDELFIDFLEGEGEAVLKVANETIEMDYYNKKFNLNANNCNNRICEFKLVISLKNKNDINPKYKYNILFKDNLSRISIPAFETIYGILKNGHKEHKYSIKNISEYYNYELDCNFCKFQEENRTEDEIIFSIKLKEDVEVDFDVYYNFRINFYNNEKVTLYHLNSLRNHHYCEINEENPCYYLVHIEQYNEIKYLQFLVQNIQNAKIFLKRFKNDEKEEDIYQKIVDGTIDSYDKNSSGNYLNFTNDCQECNILLKITSDNEINAKVNIVYDIFKRDYSSTINIYKDDFSLINSNICKNLDIELINTKEEYYILDINLIQGKEEIVINNNENNEKKIYNLKKNIKDNLNFFSSLNNNYTIQLNADDDIEIITIIYYRKIKSKSKSIIKEINFGISNYLIYEKQDEIPYQSFYINLNEVTIKNENIHLNYKYLEILNQQYNDDLSLELFMVDEDYIIQEKECLNNDDSLYFNLDDIITYYQKDMGAGYVLLNKSSYVDDIDLNNYLYIKLNNKPKKEFEFAITLTDFSENNDMPINIYLFMFIKDKKDITITINDEQSSDTYHFIEISNDSNLKISCSNNKNIVNGKTFYVGGNTYEFLFQNNDEEPGKMPNLLIKRGVIKSNNFSYFHLNDNNIIYNESKKSISFEQVVPYNLDLDYSVIYNILIFDKDIGINNILEKTKPISSKIYNNNNSEIIDLNINDILIGKYGNFYINILAEAKTKDEEKSYEYIVYAHAIIKTETNITISEKEDMTIFNDAEKVKIVADISIDDKDITQYKFIKLILITHNEEDKEKKFEIYASSESSFLNTKETDNLYEKSEFKSVDSYNNTVLAIPLESCKARKLYIQIPCREVSTFTLIYRIENGRKMEGITIHENTCFDISLKESISDDLNYRFVYTINKDYYPLITFTTYEINDEYKLIATGLENSYLKQFFHNGYAFMIKYTEDYFEYHTFIIKPFVTNIFRICHRIIVNNEANPEAFTPVSIGENIYSALRNKMNLLKDCFKIKKENENEKTQYMFNYISKSQNMKLKIIRKENDVTDISLFHESGNILLESEDDKFCLFLREEAEDEVMDYDFHGSINFQIFEIKKNNENPQKDSTILMPLINGYFVKQILSPGQSIYYRSYKYKSNSKYLIMHLQKLNGEITIEKSHCNNYPNNEFGEHKHISDSFYPDNYYDQESLKENEKEVYNKANFLVYYVKCNNNKDKNGEDCVFYIGLHNENSYLSLNENRRIYFQFSGKKQLLFSTQFYIDTYIENEEGEEEDEQLGISKKFYLEINLLKGKFDFSKALINGSNIWHNFDNKTYYFSTQPYGYIFNVGFYSFLNNIEIEAGTLFSISYRILLYKNNMARKDDCFYNITEGEMHYNILTPQTEKFSYYYSKISTTKKYIVSIFGINSDISVNNSKDYSKFRQFSFTDCQTTDITCNIDYNFEFYDELKQCEFIFSFAELNEGEKSITKKIEFDGFDQFYKINEEFKYVNLYYNLKEEKLKNDYILITIKKNNTCHLKIEYGLKNDYKTDYFINLPFSKETKKMVDIFRLDKKELGEIQKDNDQFLMFRLSTQNESIYEFNIRINIKNNPIHLGPKEIEFSSIKLNEPLYYYFDYNSHEETGNPEQLEEIYLYNKGNVKMKVAALDYLSKYPYSPNDTYKIIQDDNNFNYTTNESESNHIKITNKNNNIFGSRIYIKVYLENNKNINDNYYYNSFYICRHSQFSKFLSVRLNSNMFGYFYAKNKEKYYYKTNDITQINGSLIINFDCFNCTLNIFNYDSEDKIVLTSSYIFNRENSSLNYSIDDIKFYITGDTGYYYFSLSDSNSARYIEESEPELCLGSCKFIFPLYNFSKYLTQIIVFYSPDYEKININVTTADKPEKEEIIPDFDEDTEIENFNNKLFYNISKDDIDKEKYLKIYVTSEDKNHIFHFIMSKFITSNNTDNIKHTKQIICTEANKTKDNIFSIEEEEKYFYQMDFKFISGRGNVILKGEEEYIYELDYEYHPHISAIIQLSKFSISSQNSDQEQNFTFFFNVTRLAKNYKDVTTQLDYAQNYKIKYYLNENDAFPLNLKINCKKDYTTFVNYRFINPEFSKRPDNQNLYNTTDYDFFVHSIDTLDENLISIKSKFFHDFQRGVIAVYPKENYLKNHINLTIEKSGKNKHTYKNLYLEISLVYLRNDENEAIYIPKNSYIQFDLNKYNSYQTNILEFVETNPEYNYSQIEIANTTDFINITSSFHKCSLENKYGKRTYKCYNKAENNTSNSTSNNTINDTIIDKLINTFTLISNKSVTVLVKYTTKKNENDFPKFSISAPIIVEEKYDQKNSSNNNESKVDLTQHNIETNNYSDVNLSYFVRLYDHLRFFNSNEVDSILINFNGNKSFRWDCYKSQKCNDSRTYNVNFGFLRRVDYFISIIGEVTFNDSVEYLSYEPIKFKLDNIKDPEFEPKWAIPLVFVLLLFCAIAGYIIYFNIKKYKEKKGKNQESKADILINDGDNVKDMKDVSEEDEDDNKDKEDEDDEEDDELNKNLIKV